MDVFVKTNEEGKLRLIEKQNGTCTLHEDTCGTGTHTRRHMYNTDKMNTYRIYTQTGYTRRKTSTHTFEVTPGTRHKVNEKDQKKKMM